jgi:transposase-like protein
MASNGLAPSGSGRVSPRCPTCRSGARVETLQVSDVSARAQYWKCGRCAFVWATREGEDLQAIGRRPQSTKASMTDRAPRSNARRATNQDDLQSRLDANTARTRMLLKCARAVRATVRSPYGVPFTPRCVRCQHAGRSHDAPLTAEQHYICTCCDAHWTVQSQGRRYSVPLLPAAICRFASFASKRSRKSISAPAAPHPAASYLWIGISGAAPALSTNPANPETIKQPALLTATETARLVQCLFTATTSGLPRVLIT